MSRGRGIRGTALRATCPECGRSIACYADCDALVAGAGLTYLLQPHNAAPRVKCRGWRVGKSSLERSEMEPGDEVHSTGTGLAMTVVAITDEGLVRVWHHVDESFIDRTRGSLMHCRRAGCRRHTSHPQLEQALAANGRSL